MPVLHLHGATLDAATLDRWLVALSACGATITVYDPALLPDRIGLVPTLDLLERLHAVGTVHYQPDLPAALRRKLARRAWPGSRDSSPLPRLPPQQGLAVMWELAVQAWELAGRPLPTYSRAEMPCRRRRLGDPP